MGALVVCFPMLLQRHPRTPLRVLCISAFEYLARLGGGTLGRGRREAMAHACDFGSLRDEYYDEGKLDVREYRSLRRALRWMAPEAATVRYIQQLRKAERGRPELSAAMPGITDATIAYRNSVIDLSLGWLRAISGLSVERARCQSMANLVCLVQLADDLLDWKKDQAGRCPSYVTACLLEAPGREMARRLRDLADVLLQGTIGAGRGDAGAVPFAVAGMATWGLVLALLKVRFPK